MKKDVKSICLIVFLLIIFLLIVNTTEAITIIGKEITGKAITGESVTGEIVTGEATRPLNMNITIIALPTLNIISPENKTYLTNNSLLLNYSISGADAVWYNLDNLNNITITSSIYFNASQGSHVLYLYANNSQGTSAESVAFVANSTRFIILYSEYNSSTKGSSINFIAYPYENLQSLNNIILENTLSGKILFNQAINLTNDENPNDNFLDIDSYINISFKRIEINSTALPNFNKSATLWLYNLTYTNPKILRDGVTCPLTICTIESYSSGTLKFNVTGFSIYTTIETPVSEESPYVYVSGGSAVLKKDFSIDKEKIKISLKQGEAKKEKITIKNAGKQEIKIELEIQELKDFMNISEASFNLSIGESKTIDLEFFANNTADSGLYRGKLIVRGGNLEKEILIEMEISSEEIAKEIPKIPEIFTSEKIIAFLPFFIILLIIIIIFLKILKKYKNSENKQE